MSGYRQPRNADSPMTQKQRIEELERRVQELERRPPVLQPITVQPWHVVQPFYHPWTQPYPSYPYGPWISYTVGHTSETLTGSSASDFRIKGNHVSSGNWSSSALAGGAQ